MRFKRFFRTLLSKRYWLGFKGRYILSIAVAASIIATTLTSLIPKYVSYNSLRLVREQSQSLTGVLLEAIGISLEFSDYDAVKVTFDNIGKAESRIMYLNVIGEKGVSLAKYEKHSIGPVRSSDFDDSGFITGDGFLMSKRTIQISEIPYTLYLGLDSTQITDMERALQASISILLWAAVFGIIIGMMIVVEILNRPLDVLIERMENVATGEADLTRRIELKSKDEFGDLSKWINEFIDRIRELITKISDSTQSVVQIGNKVTEASGMLAIGAESQQVQITDMATSLQEMVTNMFEASQNTTEATHSAIQAAQAAVDGGAIIEEAIHGMGMIATSVHESSVKIEELGVHSEKIGHIVSVIDDIADQTNLLALNASIEAARAGEHGRGFAVVADEVRVLAERTIQATAEISTMVKGIQLGTSNAVSAMDEGIKRVDQGVSLSENAGKSIQEIISLNAHVQEAIQLISSAASEQSNGANLIASTIEIIKQNTESAAGSAQLMAESAGQLDEETEMLSEQVSQFILR